MNVYILDRAAIYSATDGKYTKTRVITLQNVAWDSDANKELKKAKDFLPYTEGFTM